MLGIKERQTSIFPSPAEVPPGLFERIQDKIALIERRRQKEKLILAIFLSAASAVVIIAASAAFYGRFVDSDLGKIISLVFSDGTVIARFWQDYLFYFLEILPVMPLALIFLVVLVFLGFLKLAINNFYKYRLIVKEKKYAKI